MNYIDISWPISSTMTTYKNKSDVHIDYVKTFHQDQVRESRITMGMHTGTHIDLPAHFLEQGEDSNFFSLEQVNGMCQVIDLTHCQEKITAQDLLPFTFEQDIVLFKTKNSYYANTGEFQSDFVYIDESAAFYMQSTYPTLKAIGIDYLGVERNQQSHMTHISLLQNGITIIEGLRLASVEQGVYELRCLPLKIEHVEALPARALLVEK